MSVPYTLIVHTIRGVPLHHPPADKRRTKSSRTGTDPSSSNSGSSSLPFSSISTSNTSSSAWLVSLSSWDPDALQYPFVEVRQVLATTSNRSVTNSSQTTLPSTQFRDLGFVSLHPHFEQVLTVELVSSSALLLLDDDNSNNHNKDNEKHVSLELLVWQLDWTTSINTNERNDDNNANNHADNMVLLGTVPLTLTLPGRLQTRQSKDAAHANLPNDATTSPPESYDKAWIPWVSPPESKGDDISSMVPDPKQQQHRQKGGYIQLSLYPQPSLWNQACHWLSSSCCCCCCYGGWVRSMASRSVQGAAAPKQPEPVGQEKEEAL